MKVGSRAVVRQCLLPALSALAVFIVGGIPARGDVIVFSSGFEYAAGDPAVGTDVNNMNGAIGQIGTWSSVPATLPGADPTADGGTELISFPDYGTPSGNAMECDRPLADVTLVANLAQTVSTQATTFSFDYATRRTTSDHGKDITFIGYDQSDQESFHLVISASSTLTGEQSRVGAMVGGTTIWDLPDAADADGDLPFTTTGSLDSNLRTITLELAAGGYTISFDKDRNGAIDGSDWTTSLIGYNGSATSLSRIEISLHGGAGSGSQSGMFLDNVLVTAVPEPSAWATLIGLSGCAVAGGLWRRRRRASA